METIIDNKIVDKTSWERGPWDEEPDKMQWRDQATGLPCLIVRSPHSGSLCGYVAVDSAHVLYGSHYDEPEVEVHGGLTYCGECSEQICHKVEEGEDDKVWWFGFDCAHYMDRSPGVEAALKRVGHTSTLLSEGTYRGIAYVTAQVESLAMQLSLVQPKLLTHVLEA